MTDTAVHGNAVCLGCGCTCDDIEIVVDRGSIVDSRNACLLGATWFGNGHASTRIRIDGQDSSLDAAIGRAGALLAAAKRPRVLLGRDVSCEAYKEGVACADLLRSRLDMVTARATRDAVLAVQEQGLATATLGEIRNRADLLVFWAVDPSIDFPRYASRYAPLPTGTHVADGRRSRTVIAVDVDAARGPADADLRIEVAHGAEVEMLGALTALLSGATGRADTAFWEAASRLADLMRAGRYVAVVADAQSGSDHDAARMHRLASLSHALNLSGRGAVSLLRRGGNLSGAETVMLAQTGFPHSIDFASGAPHYRPYEREPWRGTDACLLIGVPDRQDVDELESMTVPLVAIGRAASLLAAGRAAVAIDTGTVGIHSAGTVVRMDDVPLPARTVLPGALDAAAVCAQLRLRLRETRA